MKIPFYRFRAWLPGLITALAGVACVRLLAPLAPPAGAVVLSVAGYLCVPLGLALVARQIHRGALSRADSP